MAAMLFCKRMVARPKLCRSIMGQEPERPKPVEKKFLWVFEANEWSKKKNPWEDDIITMEKERKPALSQDLESTTYEESRRLSYVTFAYKQNVNWKGSDPYNFIRLLKYDFGSQADAHRTHSYNKFLRPFFRMKESAQWIARSFLTDMLVNGAIPDLATFSILIRYYCKHFEYQCILDVVYTQMKALGVEADESFYKILIYGVCTRFGPCVGYQLLKELRFGSGAQMSLSCYDAVVRQFCKRKTNTTMTSGLIDVLMDMKQERIFPDNKIYHGLIKGLRYHGDEGFSKAAGIGRQMFAQGMKIGVLSNIVKKRRLWKRSLEM